MKKKFTFMMAALMLLTMFAIPMGMVGQTRETKNDELTAASFTATSTTYTDFSGVTFTSNAVYAGNSAKTSGGAIQLRSKNSTSGIVSTTSGGTIHAVSVDFESESNTLDIYGKNTAYTSASDLYNSSTQGTKIGSISANGTVTLSAVDQYEFIGLRSNSGALYLSSITITWTTSGGSSPVDPTITFNNGSVFVGKTLDLSTLFSSNSNGAVTYSITSGSSYASISGSVITGVAEGTVTVQASQAATASYNAANTSATITVSPYVQPTVIEAGLNNTLFGTTYNGSVSNITDENPIVGSQDNVKVTYAGGGNHYVNNTSIRFYSGNKLTFEAPSGYEIKQIGFTPVSGGTWTTTISANGGTYTSDTKTWVGNASSVIFTGSGSGSGIRCDMESATIIIGLPAASYGIDYAPELSNGTFADGNPNSAAEDESVTITTVPAAGYHLATMTYNDGTSHNATVSGNSGSFTMPAADVTVSATFAENVATFTNGEYTETMTTQASFDNMTVIDNEGDQTWGYDSQYNCAYITGYDGTYNNANEDWLITPKMAVENGKLDITFESWHNSYGAELLSVKWASSLNGDWTNLSFTEGDASTWNTSALTITTDATNVYVAFVYTSTSSAAGKWELRNFKAKQYYTITLSATNGTLTSTPAGKAAVGADVTLNPSPNTNYHFASYTVDPVSVIITNNAFTMPAENVTVSTTFEHDATYTITFVENGSETYTDDDIAGGLIGNNLPSTPFGSVPANLDFVGWSTSEIGTYQTTLPTLVDESYNVAANVTFFAVYKYDYNYTTGGGTPYWAKVTDASTLAAGDQLVIASEDGEAVAGDISSQLLGVEGAEFSNGIMTSHSSDAVEFVLGVDENAWTFENENGDKLGATAAKKMAWNNGTTTWSISIDEGNASITNTTTSCGSIQYNYNQGNPRFTSYTSTQGPVQLYRLEDGSTTVSGTYYLTSVTVHSTDVEVSDATTWTGNHSVNTFVTITSAGKLTVNGLLVSPDEAAITIEDGGQLVCNNDGVYATFKKSIVPTTETNDNTHWYSIASPVNNKAIASVPNMVSGAEGFKYNLYRYDESMNEWEAYNQNTQSSYYHPDFTTLENGRGYLYRNNINSINNSINGIEFAGVINVGDVENIALTKANRGFNLIGNPFGHNIYKGEGAAIDNTGLNDGFYYLSNMGAWEAGDCEDAIAPNTGILVQVNDDNGVNLTITDTQTAATGESRYANDKIKFIVSCGDYEDVAYAKFHKGNGLNKINHRNANAPMIYIPQDGENYAIAMMEDNTKVFGLNFKAATMGQYTLSYKADGNFNYLHVIDRLTGNDTDMLIDGEYTFVATPNDNENRFIVKLEYMPDYSEGNNEIFAYQTGSEILVSGLGELQIFDVTGRNVMTRTINGAETINGMNAGVYIFRLNEMIQKIVVR